MAGFLNLLFFGCLLQEDPPKPILSPSTLRVKEGTSVSLSCSAPAACLSHPPTLTWTPRLGDIQETLQEDENKTKDMTSSMTFTASKLHHRQEISCTAVYKKRDGSKSSVRTNLTADISFAPQILPSSGCTKTADQLNCSCEAVGNPFPTLQWYLDESPVHHLDGFVVSSEPLNETGVRSFIAVNQPQKREISILLCHSSNPLGSAAQQFCVYCFSSQIFSGQECFGQVSLPVFTVTVSMLTAALVCALLFAISAHGTCRHHSTKSEYISDESTTVMSQDLTSENGNKVSITSEEDIYVNTNIMRMSDEPNTHQQHVSKNSKRKKEDGSDVIYSSLIWKSKSKKKRGERSGNRNPSGSSYLEQEKCMEGGRNYVSNALEMGSLYGNMMKNDEKSIQEYGQVKFRDKKDMHK